MKFLNLVEKLPKAHQQSTYSPINIFRIIFCKRLHPAVKALSEAKEMETYYIENVETPDYGSEVLLVAETSRLQSPEFRITFGKREDLLLELQQLMVNSY